MKFFLIFAAALVAVSAQEFEPTYTLQGIPDQDFEGIPHPRFRRGVSMDPKTGDVTARHGGAFGTLGSNDNGLFGKAGYERNVFNDQRGRLDAQAYGQRTLGPLGDSSSLGGALRWRDDHASASFDVNKQIHGGTSWTAAGGGRWPVGRNGDFGLEGTYSHLPGGMRDYGGRGVFNYRF